MSVHTYSLFKDKLFLIEEHKKCICLFVYGYTGLLAIRLFYILDL